MDGLFGWLVGWFAMDGGFVLISRSNSTATPRMYFLSSFQNLSPPRSTRTSTSTSVPPRNLLSRTPHARHRPRRRARHPAGEIEIGRATAAHGLAGRAGHGRGAGVFFELGAEFRVH
jgi:hypothetical protein